MPESRRLITIPVSHYCEKARWALDRAGMRYSEEPHIPIVSVLHARRAGGGMTVPVLVVDGRVYRESHDILEYVQGRVPEERKLYPEEPQQRDEVRALERRFDHELGPATRLLGYAGAAGRRDLAPYVAEGVPAWERRSLLATFPAATFSIRRRFGINEQSVAAANRTVDEIFGDVGRRLEDGRRYLVGDRFSAADLTFAALASPMLAPPEFSVPLPPASEMPDDTAARMRELAEHRAGRFALRMFAEERQPASVPAAAT